jgi:hypothetical protein
MITMSWQKYVYKKGRKYLEYPAESIKVLHSKNLADVTSDAKINYLQRFCIFVHESTFLNQP